ncbi:hypothetical protein Tco_0307589, partial [Tanacetum coccineum]
FISSLLYNAPTALTLMLHEGNYVLLAVLFGSNKEDASASAIKLLETKDESEVGLNDGQIYHQRFYLLSKPLSRGVVGKTLMVEELGRRKVNAAYSGVLRRLALCLLLRASSHTISTQEVARRFLRRLAQRFDMLCQGRSAREHPSLDSISMIVL